MKGLWVLDCQLDKISNWKICNNFLLMMRVIVSCRGQCPVYSIITSQSVKQQYKRMDELACEFRSLYLEVK